MSRRMVSLPLRLASTSSINAQSRQWVCRRCLATQPETTTPSYESIPATTTSARPVAPVSHSASVTPENYDPTLPATKCDYRLSKTDFYLKKALPHAIPLQYLHHSTSDLLPPKERTQREEAIASGVAKPLTGIVVSAGKMDKTVRVRVPTRTWNKKIGKYFSSEEGYMVHDPNNSLVAGDVISMHRLTVSTAVHHVVASIVAPYGTPIDQRAPIPSPDDRLAEYKAQRFAKLQRRALRKAAAEGDEAAIQKLDAMGLGEKDPAELASAVMGKGQLKAARVRAEKIAKREARVQKEANVIELEAKADALAKEAAAKAKEHETTQEFPPSSSPV